MAEAISIGPGAIMEPGTDGGPAFVLAKPEWIALQISANNGCALPGTNEHFRTSLGRGAPTDLSDFETLIANYQRMNTVQLGSRIYFPW